MKFFSTIFSTFFYFVSLLFFSPTIGFSTTGDIIDEYLQIEARQRTVGEAIAIKETALPYVRDISDFERLSQYAVFNPSPAYIGAVGQFILRHVDRFLRGPADIDSLNRLELKLQTVGDSKALKEKGLGVIYNVSDLIKLGRPVFYNPSPAYLDMISEFYAANASQAVSDYTSISEMLYLESKTKYVAHAIAVKRAGLRLVRNRRDLLELSRIVFVNPSQAYVSAVDNFRRENEWRFPTNEFRPLKMGTAGTKAKQIH